MTVAVNRVKTVGRGKIIQRIVHFPESIGTEANGMVLLGGCAEYARTQRNKLKIYVESTEF